MAKRIYIDMDGTLCRFHDAEHKYIEQMWEKGFYANLQPFEEFVKAISLCIDRNADTEFFYYLGSFRYRTAFCRRRKTRMVA